MGSYLEGPPRLNQGLGTTDHPRGGWGGQEGEPVVGRVLDPPGGSYRNLVMLWKMENESRVAAGGGWVLITRARWR
jgi:hypothetical protein